MWLKIYHLCKDIYIFSKDGPRSWPCCSAELNILINFGRRPYEEHLNLHELFRVRGDLKIFLIYSSGSLFVQYFQTICRIMAVGLMQNISVKQYLFGTVVQEEKLYKVISYLEIWQPIC